MVGNQKKKVLGDGVCLSRKWQADFGVDGTTNKKLKKNRGTEAKAWPTHETAEHITMVECG